MNSPKRKVTDLLPSEAILISSDADLKVLEEFEKVGITWIDGALASSFNPISFTGEQDLIIHIELERIVWAYTEGSGLTIYPATDFIPTEAERGLTIIKGNGSIITEQNQDGRVFDIEPIPTEAEKVEVDKFETIDFKLGVFIRSRIDWYESNHDYQVATDTIRCWLDDFLLEHKTRNPETK